MLILLNVLAMDGSSSSSARCSWDVCVRSIGDALMRDGNAVDAGFCYMLAGCPLEACPFDEDRCCPSSSSSNHNHRHLLSGGSTAAAKRRLILCGAMTTTAAAAAADPHPNAQYLTAFHRTEAWEAAKRRGNPRCLLPTLQWHKVWYAHMCAEYGMLARCRAYVDAVRSAAAVRGGQFRALDVLEDRVCVHMGDAAAAAAGGRNASTSASNSSSGSSKRRMKQALLSNLGLGSGVRTTALHPMPSPGSNGHPAKEAVGTPSPTTPLAMHQRNLNAMPDSAESNAKTAAAATPPIASRQQQQQVMSSSAKAATGAGGNGVAMMTPPLAPRPPTKQQANGNGARHAYKPVVLPPKCPPQQQQQQEEGSSIAVGRIHNLNTNAAAARPPPSSAPAGMKLSIDTAAATATMTPVQLPKPQTAASTDPMKRSVSTPNMNRAKGANNSAGSSTPRSLSQQQSPSSASKVIGDIRSWFTKKLHPNAVEADVGDSMEAYYDEKLKRWVFPGEDPDKLANDPKLGPPPTAAVAAAPVMKGKEGSGAPDKQPEAADPLAALMAPPPRASSGGGANAFRRTPLISRGPPRGTAAATPPAVPKFTVFQPTPQQQQAAAAAS